MGVFVGRCAFDLDLDEIDFVQWSIRFMIGYPVYELAYWFICRTRHRELGFVSVERGG